MFCLILKLLLSCCNCVFMYLYCPHVKSIQHTIYCSYDLIPKDFCVWGDRKRTVYKTEIHNEEEIGTCLLEVFEIMLPMQEYSNVFIQTKYIMHMNVVRSDTSFLFSQQLASLIVKNGHFAVLGIANCYCCSDNSW